MTEIRLDVGNLNSGIPDGASEINNVDLTLKKNTYKPNSFEPKMIILFDGVCNVCDGFVQFVFPRDVNKKFYYQALQTEKGKEILDYYNLPCDMSTIVLIDENTGKYFTKSTAVLNICYNLKAPFPYLYSFYYIPSFIRDFCYGTFAKYRYLIMGKKDSCFFSINLRDRFIDFKSPMIDMEDGESKDM